MFFYVHDWSRGLFSSPEVRQSPEVGQQQAREELSTSVYMTAFTSNSCYQLMIPRCGNMWRKSCQKKTLILSPDSKAEDEDTSRKKRGATDFRFTKRLSCDHCPSKAAGVTGHIMFDSACRNSLGSGSCPKKLEILGTRNSISTEKSKLKVAYCLKDSMNVVFEAVSVDRLSKGSKDRKRNASKCLARFLCS